MGPQHVSQDLPSDLDTLFSDDAMHNGLIDFDFGEFWQSVKPLMEDSLGIDTPLVGQSQGQNETIHADDMQSLFSGCLM